jgi:hypothetical protein
MDLGKLSPLITAGGVSKTPCEFYTLKLTPWPDYILVGTAPYHWGGQEEIRCKDT